MKKLRALWNIIKADKWAVFTFEEAPYDQEWMTAPYFKWNISHGFKENEDFYQLIKNRVRCIERFKGNESEND